MPLKSFRAVFASVTTAALVSLSASGLYACGSTPTVVGASAYQAAEYLLGPGDKLDVSVFGEDTMTGQYVVASSGNIAFPLVGSVDVEGRTVAAVQSELLRRLDDGILNNPQVTVEVANYRPFYILGEVTRSGEYEFSDKLTVTQAIASAGGYSYRADRKKIYITRAGGDREELYDLRDGRAIYISPGDTIRIGERYF